MIFISGVLTSLAQDKHTITIEFTGMESDKGSLFVALYNKETDFLKKPCRRKIVEIKNKKATAVFEGILPGVYAVSSFHDENDNKKMDTNEIVRFLLIIIAAGVFIYLISRKLKKILRTQYYRIKLKV